MTHALKFGDDYRRLLSRWNALRTKPYTTRGERVEIVELGAKLDEIELAHERESGYDPYERVLLGHAGAWR